MNLTISYINPERMGNDSANRRLIPFQMPDNLIPLVNENNENNFYADSQEFPDLIPSSSKFIPNLLI